IVFGTGAFQQIGSLVTPFGRRAFVVTGRNPARAEPLIKILSQNGIASTSFPVCGEPTIGAVEEGAERARRESAEFVIGFGGGSALDAAKAIGVLVTNGGSALDYLEVIGKGLALSQPSIPVVAIPTTAGTGAEVTRNAVLASPEHRVKASLRSPFMLPRIALVDPEVTYDLPPALTATTGLDALTQLIEPYVSVRSNPMTDALCLDGMARVARSLRPAFRVGHDPVARQDMAMASLFGGLALANAALGAVHGFAAPIGGMFNAPHGAICAALLPHVVKLNIRALRQRAPNSESLHRFQRVARILTGQPDAYDYQAVDWLRELCADLRIPSLSAFGLTANDFPMLIERGKQASSMKGNPISLTDDELREVLERAL
ncbi:MAG: iron-containing alcohol dehydrogenase, partial [Verrucomicrobiota bacterium]